VKIRTLLKHFNRGDLEVEQILAAALQASIADAAVFESLAIEQAALEEQARLEGLESFPTRIWLELAAVFVRGGYPALEVSVSKDKRLFPFMMGFCEAAPKSLEAWKCLQRLVSKSACLSVRQKREVLDAINLVFVFGNPGAPLSPDFRPMHDFVLAQVSEPRNRNAALCAARAFGTPEMLLVVEAAPEPKGDYRDVKKLAINAVKKRLRSQGA
jgi:hypothetical protein